MTKENTSLDTLLEFNSPQFLDLSSQQLFIDTSRNSRFYDEMDNWTPGEFDIKGTEYYLTEIGEEFDKQIINLKNFPSDWITVKKINNQYVIYSPNNGISGRYKITNHSINLYAIESDADAISSLEYLSDSSIQIKLNTISEKSESRNSIFSIQKTKIDFIYLLKWTYDDYELTSLVTPLEKIREFNMVVHHSQTLVYVPINFDKIDYDLIIEDLK